MPMECGTAPAKTYMALECLESQVRIARERLAELENRISPSLKPIPMNGNPTDKSEDSSSSPLVERILNSYRELIWLNDRIAYLIDACEL
jgi:hypothetical protein